MRLKKDREILLQTKEGYATTLFTLIGAISVDGEEVEEKTSILYKGNEISITALEDAEIVWMAAPRIDEKIAWGGPIVMNEPREIQQAFLEMREGTFIKEDLEI